MELTILMADPAGNRTAIVRTPVPAGQRAETAARIMEIPELRAEQVGFEVPPRPGAAGRLEMMGGEFCGNAARSYGYLLWTEQAKRRGDTAPRGEILIEISGHTGLLRVECEAETDGCLPSGPGHVSCAPGPGTDGFDLVAAPIVCDPSAPGPGSCGSVRGTPGCARDEGHSAPASRILRGFSFAEMPMPERLACSPEGCPMVISEGITHMILEDREPDPALIRQLIDRYGGQFDAFGLQFLKDGQLVPVVYVPAAGSLVYESSCGSGSLAAAWYMEIRAEKTKKEAAGHAPDTAEAGRSAFHEPDGAGTSLSALREQDGAGTRLSAFREQDSTGTSLSALREQDGAGTRLSAFREQDSTGTSLYTFREPGGEILVRLTRDAAGKLKGFMGGAVKLEKEIRVVI